MINAVIADDSPLLRRILKDVLQSTSKIKVVGEGKNGKEAIKLVEEKKPDILILDCEMPVMNGLEALRRIMKEHPLPVFMFSSLTTEGASVTVKALEYGAIDFMPKPSSGALGLEKVAEILIAKIEAVVRKERRKSLFKPRVKPAVALKPPAARKPVKAKPLSSLDVIVIGSSTGGVKAALEVLVDIEPTKCPPIVWVQHMPPAFTTSLAERGNAQAKITIKEAQEGDALAPGVCLLAPGGMHMKLVKKGSRCEAVISPGESLPGVRPSCDHLFNSAADIFGSRILGVILTGMGSDGARGLKKMHGKGSYVLGQDEATCIVYGMPKAAYQIGAVDEQLPLGNIAERINQIIASTK